jgi:hypothetical protein
LSLVAVAVAHKVQETCTTVVLVVLAVIAVRSVAKIRVVGHRLNQN